MERASGFEGRISQCFGPYMGDYIKMEDQQMKEKMEQASVLSRSSRLALCFACALPACALSRLRSFLLALFPACALSRLRSFLLVRLLSVGGWVFVRP
jgi:hypothetical protein